MPIKVPISEDTLSFLKASYDSLGRAGCAKALGITSRQMANVANRLGIRMFPEARTRWYRKTKDIPNDQRKVNPEVFMNLKTPEAAYVLGLMWADGCVSRQRGTTSTIIISQIQEDMKDVARTLDKTGQWRYTSQHQRKPGVNIQRQGRAYTSNRTLADYLDAHGYQAKGHVSADAILATIPDHLKHYWFRGLFDGDGCLWFKATGKGANVRWLISSSYEQDWSYLKDLCRGLGVTHSIVRTERKPHPGGIVGRGSILKLSRRKDIAIMMNYLYQGREQDGIGLDRKWHHWLTYRTIPIGVTPRHPRPLKASE